MVDQSQLDQDLRYLKIGKDEGARLAFGGELLNRDTPGFYLQPALFTEATNSMRIAREEIFGPVACVIRAKNYDEALAIANDTEFGPAAGICTTSLKYASHFKRNSEAGMVMVNLPTAGVDYHVPFGGRKGSSYGAARAGFLRARILHDGEDRLYQSGLTSGAHMDQSIGAREQPRYIKLNDRDNVAIVVNDFGLTAGARFACGLTLRAFVPQGHKTALVDIEEGAPIVRYGEVIGYAASPILAGEWVDEARIRMPDAPSLDALEIATAVPPSLPPLEGFSFEGFRNADGSVGTKNILGDLDLGAMRRRHDGIRGQAASAPSFCQSFRMSMTSLR